ncbi:MAG TPA: phosphate ABC transporter permease subunit PstC [Patescibacteria group bacterium]|nr:phosphate ABC transporter permease subunit PstC [Patescibacteria group bacterium]
MTTLGRSSRLTTGGGSRLPDRLFRGGSGVFAFGVIVLLFSIGILLFLLSIPTWREFGLAFVTGTEWDPVQSIYGALPFIVGTLLTSFLALIIAAPIGLLTAIFLAELAPRRVAVPVGFLVELLAAIPSVVIGLWGVYLLSPFLRTTVEEWITSTIGQVIPFFAGPTFGVGIFAAGVILSIMILPTIVSISREVITAVPNSQREAMLALGATRWETVTRAVLPFAKSGIIGAIILGLGRALGETMAVTMVIGNSPQIPTRLFDQGQTISSQIATTFNEAQVGLQTSALIALGFVLLIMTISLNIVARLLVRRVAGDGVGQATGG